MRLAILCNPPATFIEEDSKLIAALPRDLSVHPINAQNVLIKATPNNTDDFTLQTRATRPPNVTVMVERPRLRKIRDQSEAARRPMPNLHDRTDLRSHAYHLARSPMPTRNLAPHEVQPLRPAAPLPNHYEQPTAPGRVDQGIASTPVIRHLLLGSTQDHLISPQLRILQLRAPLEPDRAWRNPPNPDLLRSTVAPQAPTHLLRAPRGADPTDPSSPVPSAVPTLHVQYPSSPIFFLRGLRLLALCILGIAGGDVT